MADGLIGTTAGNYRILDKISDGGMGSVYRAEHALIGRLVAVKVLLPELTGNREIVDRFFREAKATTAIKHPGIVEVFDFGYLDSGLAYIVMELLEGMTLARRIKMRGAMPEGEAASLLRGVCSSLAAAHDKGIVHRDLKPDNLFLVQDLDIPNGERIKLLDAAAGDDASGTPGEVLDDCLSIACGSGYLRPLEVQRAGRAPMTPGELLRGFAIPKGTILT